MYDIDLVFTFMIIIYYPRKVFISKPSKTLVCKEREDKCVF